MPKKQKKQQRNAFYFYMKELEPALRREGRVFPNGMADVVEIAHPRWKALPQKEKDRFEKMAKDYKLMMRGKEGDKLRHDNQGNIVAHRKDPLTEYEKRRQHEKKDIVKDWPPGKAAAQEKFHFINFQTMCKTLDGTYLPCEMALIEYTIEKGITKKLHKFIDPGQIPKGYMFTCRQQSEDTHQIPPEQFDKADSNYRGIWIQLENFINPQGQLPDNPPIYTLGAKDNWEVTERCLEWLHGNACLGIPNRIRKVYELESLFQELHAHVGNPVSKTICINTLTSSEWDYEPNTRCPYHEELEVKDCSLGILVRHAYAISDSICEYYDVQLTKNHLPMRKPTQAYSILPPNSMSISSRNQARISPQKSNPPIQRPPPQRQQLSRPAPEEEDYESLRQPRIPVPVASVSGGASAYGAGGGPAWGRGAGGADFPPMGPRGYVSDDSDFPPMGPRGYMSDNSDFPPMGRGVSSPDRDFPPMGRGAHQMGNRDMSPVGRGLTTGMQGLNVSPQRFAGRAAPPHPSEAPPPPSNWQQPMGVGRGMMKPAPMPSGIGRGFVPPPPAAFHYQQDEEDDGVTPLRLPGQTAPSHVVAGQFQDTGGEPHYGEEADVEVSVSREGRGRGGILKHVMQNGLKRDVPQGRGFMPPDWVDDGSMGQMLR